MVILLKPFKTFLKTVCKNVTVGHQYEYNFIVSFRYDYFDIKQNIGIDEEKIIEFIKNNLDNKYIQFINYFY